MAKMGKGTDLVVCGVSIGEVRTVSLENNGIVCRGVLSLDNSKRDVIEDARQSGEPVRCRVDFPPGSPGFGAHAAAVASMTACEKRRGAGPSSQSFVGQIVDFACPAQDESMDEFEIRFRVTKAK
jgi:pantoate kinase